MTAYKVVKDNLSFDVQCALDESKLESPLKNFVGSGRIDKLCLDAFKHSLSKPDWKTAETNFIMLAVTKINTIARELQKKRNVRHADLDHFAEISLSILCYKIDSDPNAGPLETFSIINSEVYRKWQKQKEALKKIVQTLENQLE